MRFFETNPTGRILNRFSKDTGYEKNIELKAYCLLLLIAFDFRAVDEILPKAILDAVQMILGISASILVTAVVNPIFLIPIAVLSVAFIFIRKIYVKTSKNVKRLEGISK